MRKILSYAGLLCVILWLVFSYLPESMVTLGTIAFPAGANLAFRFLLIGGVGLFLLIQAWLTVESVGLFRSGSSRVTAKAFGLTRPREVLLTVLPLLLTVGLALASRSVWASLMP